MRLLKLVVSAVLIAAAGFAVHRWCWLPYRCNQIEKAALRTTERTLEVGGGYTETVRARATAQRVLGCIEHVPTNVNLYMIVAANYRALGRYEDAIAMYRAALRYDRRPELYLNIGESYLAMGNANEAHRYFVATALFRIGIFKNVPEGAKQLAWDDAFQQLETPPKGGYVLP